MKSLVAIDAMTSGALAVNSGIAAARTLSIAAVRGIWKRPAGTAGATLRHTND
jgi:hypothetical protein